MICFLVLLRLWRFWLPFRPDVVIASSTYPADIFPASAIAKRHRAQLVWEVHDLWPLSPMQLGGMSKWHPFIMWMQFSEDAACRLADVVVSMLPVADRHLIQHGMSPQKFAVVPNGVAPTEWNEKFQNLPIAHDQAILNARRKEHLLIAYTGTHGVANALDTLIEAAHLARDQPITWFLVGMGPEKERLKRRAIALNLETLVFLDPVPKGCMPTLLSSMDILYLGFQNKPIFQYGISPNKLMDYMMSGKPVISSIRGGNDPVAAAQCGISIPPEDPQAVLNAIHAIRALTDLEMRRMGERGTAYILKFHTYSVLASRFLNIIGDNRLG